MIVVSSIRLEDSVIKNIEEKTGNKIEFILFQEDKIDSLKNCIEEAEILLINQKFFTEEFIYSCKNLKWIQLPSAGYEKVALNKIKERGITLTNARGVLSIPIAEDVICKMICLSRNYKTIFDNQKKHKWGDIAPSTELNKKTAGILGMGSIASEIAKRAKCFNMKVIGFDKYIEGAEYFDEAVKLENIDYLFKNSDFIISTLPSNEDTKGLINYSSICKMKNNAIIINASRGDIVVEKDIIKALKENIIKGAALDVFEKEPLGAENELWDLNNVIITPHNGGSGDLSPERLKALFIENLNLYPNIENIKNIICC